MVFVLWHTGRLNDVSSLQRQRSRMKDLNQSWMGFQLKTNKSVTNHVDSFSDKVAQLLCGQ